MSLTGVQFARKNLIFAESQLDSASVVGRRGYILVIFLICVLSGLLWAASFRRSQSHFELRATWAPESAGFCSVYTEICRLVLDDATKDLRLASARFSALKTAKNLAAGLGLTNWVRTLRFTRVWTGSLRAELEIEEPRALLLNHGELFAVASTGGVLRSLRGVSLPALVLLRGERLESGAQARARAIAFVDKFPMEGEFSRTNIGEIKCIDDGYELYYVPQDIYIKMNEVDLERRMGRVKQVLRYIRAHKIAAASLDTRFAKKVLVSLHKG